MRYNRAMKLIFAQGNPGPTYTRSRHNVGFRILDTLAAEHDTDFKDADKFQSRITTISVEGEKVLLIQPKTFYNETGLAARKLVDFYKLNPETDVLVVHDELSLPLGTLRVRKTGSDAGNNGIKSINAHLGATYHRLRIGIWNEHRNTMQDSDFVLSAFTAEETKLFTETIQPKALELIDAFIRDTMEPTSHTV
jgi:peptidyl-tRNA hydrolase, PTH1 family